MNTVGCGTGVSKVWNFPFESRVKAPPFTTVNSGVCWA